jgi:hypothetical protein
LNPEYCQLIEKRLEQLDIEDAEAMEKFSGAAVAELDKKCP